MNGQGKTQKIKMASKSKEKGTNKRVFVGMSGGVDSSVSAAILKRAGYEVTGVFIKVWQPDWMDCNWREDRLDAMRVAATLDIPFFTLDLEKEYKRDVVDYMIAEYKAGRTPNPDVMCNKSVKFGGFYDWAMERGADFVATGHYAKIVESQKSVKSKSEGKALDTSFGGLPGESADSCLAEPSGRELGLGNPGIARRKNVSSAETTYSLLAGSDPNKDQSYFLWNIREDQLPRILFPIGDIEKPDVRKLAHKFKLPNADKKDSQGLCFIGKVDIKEFLSHYMEPKAGKVLDEEGNAIGHHDGAFFLTIGERHGFFIDKKTPHDEPYYIVAKDLENNTITVSNKDKRGLLAQAKTLVSLEKTNWMSETPVVGKKYSGRARYRQPLEPLVFTSINEKETMAKHESADSHAGRQGTAEIEFDKPQNALTPGQSLVVYEGQVCLGGGIIL
ncbi:MAG: tRNA 2-thiouridine(34) synthase MnmA [Candidatus Pacebacteria bacterium]|nr:tRNA 2-thiouridine(34) synthase MnmA [Candidatus Paceibacterota bacterium]